MTGARHRGAAAGRPVLGHPTMTDAVAALRSEGLSRGDVAGRLAAVLGRPVSRDAVRSLERHAVATGRMAPAGGEAGRVRRVLPVRLEREAAAALAAAAARAGLPAGAAAAAVLERLARMGALDLALGAGRGDAG